MADIWDIELAKQTGFYVKAYAYPDGIDGKAWILHDTDDVPYSEGQQALSEETQLADGAVYITYALVGRMTESEAWQRDCPVMVIDE